MKGMIAAEMLLYGEDSRSRAPKMSWRHSPGGGDRPDDMATAWLAGDMEHYEELRQEYVRRHVPYESPPAPRKPHRPRTVNWKLVLELKSMGLGIRRIAKALACSNSAVQYILGMAKS